MAKINLLPPELAKARPHKEKIDFTSLNLSWLRRVILLFWIAVIIILFLGGYYRITILAQTKRLQAITNQYQAQTSQTSDISPLKEELKNLTAEYNLLNRFLEKKILWSAKLTHLRAIVPLQIWFTELYFDQKIIKGSLSGNLSLKGGLIPTREGVSLIGTLSNFINKLKEDNDFCADFDTPLLTNSRTDTMHKTEIMVFAIDMPLKNR